MIPINKIKQIITVLIVHKENDLAKTLQDIILEAQTAEGRFVSIVLDKKEESYSLFDDE